MAKGNNANSSKTVQGTVVLRFMAGVYLMYLAYGLLQEYLKPVEGGKLIQIGAAVVFFGFGGVIAGWSVLRFAKGDYIKNSQLPGNEGEDENQETEESHESKKKENGEKKSN